MRALIRYYTCHVIALMTHINKDIGHNQHLNLDKSTYFPRQRREDAEVVRDCVRAGPCGRADPYSARLLRDVLRYWRGGATCGRRDSFWKM